MTYVSKENTPTTNHVQSAAPLLLDYPLWRPEKVGKFKLWNPLLFTSKIAGNYMIFTDVHPSKYVCIEVHDPSRHGFETSNT